MKPKVATKGLNCKLSWKFSDTFSGEFSLFWLKSKSTVGYLPKLCYARYQSVVLLWRVLFVCFLMESVYLYIMQAFLKEINCRFFAEFNVYSFDIFLTITYQLLNVTTF